jgi:hypothetical protein
VRGVASGGLTSGLIHSGGHGHGDLAKGATDAMRTDQSKIETDPL